MGKLWDRIKSWFFTIEPEVEEEEGEDDRSLTEVRWSSDMKMWEFVWPDDSGVGRSGMFFEYKTQAVEHAREWCDDHRPSALVVYTKEEKVSSEEEFDQVVV